MQIKTLQALLTLMRLPFLGAATYQQLQIAFGSPVNVLAQSEQALAPYLDHRTLSALRLYNSSNVTGELALCVERDLRWLKENPNVTVLTTDCVNYPCLLANIARPPPLLFVRGNVALLDMPQLAIVGSRTPTAGGADNAWQFARYLAHGGFCITSGLALGIDAAAHRGALHATGATIAVLGTGIDLVYPLRHKKLAAQIIHQGGALVSEFMLGTSSRACNFPRRNRIISGLSLGTLVVEAAIKSGSLITARTAMEQEREVFAIPGSIHNPLAKGSHHLIKNGATLIETAKDIVDELGGMLAFKQEQLTKQNTREKSVEDNFNANEKVLINAMGYDPVDVDTLCVRCELDAGIISGLLVELELQGAVTKMGGLYSRQQIKKQD